MYKSLACLSVLFISTSCNHKPTNPAAIPETDTIIMAKDHTAVDAPLDTTAIVAEMVDYRQKISKRVQEYDIEIDELKQGQEIEQDKTKKKEYEIKIEKRKVNRNNLEEKLKAFPKKVFFGEVYGQVQDLKYDVVGHHLRIFDVYDVTTQKYHNWNEVKQIVKQAGLETVPVLYEGSWTGNEMWLYAEGKSTIASHIREGFVVKPIIERLDDTIGRVIVKLVGEQYHLRK